MRYLWLRIAGYRSCYPRCDEEAAVVDNIRTSCADMLFIAMASPQKEQFNAHHGRAPQVSFVMGVGAAS
jgi:N-acetylglucosaminyldiphosphoundecaprenol N-acetyl-beta-D-mannosaminyltransferase